MNYKCLKVCSLFFQKILSRCTNTHFIRDPPRVLQDSTPSYHRPCPLSPVLTAFWNRFKQCKQESKKCKTFTLHPNLCPSNHTNQQTWNNANLLKKSSQNELSSMKVCAFQAKWPVLVLASKYSFSKWSHIAQMGAYCNGQ